MEATTQVTQSIVDEFVGVCHGNAARVRELLAEYPELATTDASWIETPIQAAAQLANREIADMLIERGAPIDICTAAVFGMKDKVEEMLSADPALRSATGAHGIPVLYFPVVGGHKDIAEILLAAGADVNAGAGGTTPLHGAAMFNRKEMAEWLLANGADPALPNYEGKSAKQVAEEGGKTDVAEVL